MKYELLQNGEVILTTNDFKQAIIAFATMVNGMQDKLDMDTAKDEFKFRGELRFHEEKKTMYIEYGLEDLKDNG